MLDSTLYDRCVVCWILRCVIVVCTLCDCCFEFSDLGLTEVPVTGVEEVLMLLDEADKFTKVLSILIRIDTAVRDACNKRDSDSCLEYMCKHWQCVDNPLQNERV